VVVTGGDPIDLLVIGGGINGAGIARDAAGRGLSVVLCEQGDLAGATSSASTKLIHGGLRYLEYYEFRLVREALIEREVLLRAAPHIIWPLTFVLPHSPEQRPAWLIRLGLLLYDHLGGRETLPASRGLNLRRDPVGRPLQDRFTKGFSYADCWVEDSRLVVLNALDAHERGAEILTRMRCVAARRDGGLWEARLESVDSDSGGPGGGPGGAPGRSLRARAVVNAAGPWVTQVLGQLTGVNRALGLRLVKGSHLVVPRLYDGPQAYLFQNDDRRVVFAIPYESDFTLIGTTDLAYEGDPAQVAISEAESVYLCEAVNRYLNKQVAPSDAVWSYAGVRPLYDDASQDVSAVTRDYVFDVDAPDGAPPLLSVFGGKITTYRKLAEHALERLLPLLGRTSPVWTRPWTREAVLPGGDLPGADFERALADFQARHAWLPAGLARRYLRAYGTRAERLIGDAESLEGLGASLGDELYEAEVDYLVQSEWARSADDILWRRSKLGLHVTPATRERLAAHVAARLAAAGDLTGGAGRQERSVAQ
jgi:glycerol-3-phosphate dehydrogenase